MRKWCWKIPDCKLAYLIVSMMAYTRSHLIRIIRNGKRNVDFLFQFFFFHDFFGRRRDEIKKFFNCYSQSNFFCYPHLFVT